MEVARRRCFGWLRSARPKAFTLVELLVVIGIIALLIGVLLSVLSKAREAANVLVCATHLREIGIACSVYAANNKGKLPIPIGGGAFSNLNYSAILFKPDNGFYGLMDFGQGTLAPYLHSPAIGRKSFLCPSDSEPRYAAGPPVTADPQMPLTPAPTVPRNFSYAFNAELTGGLAGSRYTGVKTSEIRRPSDKLLVLKAFMPGGANTKVVGYNANGVAIVVFLSLRHGGKSNQCFADGHVELFDPSILRDTTSSNPYLGSVYLRYVPLQAP